MRAYDKKYRESAGGITTRKKYRKSDAGRASQKKYRESLRGIAYQKAYYSVPRNRIRALIRKAKLRAQRDGLDFSEDLYDALEPPIECPCCHGVIDYTVGRGRVNRDKSPSLDRVDNRRGYVAGNTCIICWRCNDIKSNATVSELMLVVLYIQTIQGEQYE